MRSAWLIAPASASSRRARPGRIGRPAASDDVHRSGRSAGSSRGAPGLMTTAGKLLFGGDVSGNFVAFDPANGGILWHTQIGQVTNAPQTYMVDGRQYVLVAAADMLYAFALYQ